MIISYILLCSISNKKLLLKDIFEKTVTKHRASRRIEKYLKRGVLARIVLKREIIRTDKETGRNEPKRGDLLAGWREKAGL